MTRRCQWGAILVGLVILAPAPAHSQTIPSPYRHIELAQALQVYGGHITAQKGDPDLGLASAPAFGIQYTGRFAAPVAGVVRLSMSPSERTIYTRPDASDLTSPLEAIDQSSATLLMAEAGMRLLLTGPRTWHSLAPYVEGTAGLLAVAGSRTTKEAALPPEQIVDFGPSFAFGIGVGTNWFVSERFSIEAGTQGLMWRLSVPEGLSRTASKDSEWIANLGLRIGGAYHF